MTRKSSIITLCIVGAVVGVSACCCCSGIFDDEEKKGDGQPGGGGHPVRHSTRTRFLPIFFGGGSSYHGGGSPSHGTGTSSSGRGGFGSTGAHGGGGVGA
jgi:hypothetical protein